MKDYSMGMVCRVCGVDCIHSKCRPCMDIEHILGSMDITEAEIQKSFTVFDKDRKKVLNPVRRVVFYDEGIELWFGKGANEVCLYDHEDTERNVFLRHGYSLVFMTDNNSHKDENLEREVVLRFRKIKNDIHKV